MSNFIWQSTERDQRYELDAPWSPRSQSASWASKPENISTANGRGRASEWTSESGLGYGLVNL